MLDNLLMGHFPTCRKVSKTTGIVKKLLCAGHEERRVIFYAKPLASATIVFTNGTEASETNFPTREAIKELWRVG